MKYSAGKISFRNVVSLIAIVAFLLVAQGQTMSAFAAEWELWPKGRGKDTPAGDPASKGAPATVKPPKPIGDAATKAGSDAGTTVAAGAKGGTIGKAALIGAGILAVGLAAGSGGGGGGGSATTAHH